MLIQAALTAANPETAVSRHMQLNGRLLTIGNQSYNLDKGRVYLISIGKAALPMAQAAATILGKNLFAGIAITKHPALSTQHSALSTQHSALSPQSSVLSTFYAAHPVSDDSSVQATEAALELIEQTNENDLVLCLISGGASALFTKPLLPLADWQHLNKALLASGCTISEFNCVRRQLDQVKGGGLAQAAAPAVVISLILSDVIGNPLADIGSGPTVPTEQTATDALDILQRYDIASAVDAHVWEGVTAVLNYPTPAIPPVNTTHYIVGDVCMAADSAAEAAKALGFQTQILTTRIEGEAREIGKVAAAIAQDAPPNHCLILGGETTVTLRGQGIGGRNLETALSAAVALDGFPQRVVASFATDGDDGPTKAAGAVVTGESVRNGRLHQLNPLHHLDNNDSYTFFHQLDSHLPPTQKTLLVTGLTGTNVNDLIFILTYDSKS